MKFEKSFSIFLSKKALYVPTSLKHFQVFLIVLGLILLEVGGSSPSSAAGPNTSSKSVPPLDKFSDLANLTTGQLNQSGTAKITGSADIADKAIGVRLLEAAIARNDIQSMVSLGKFYTDGVYLKQDSQKGLALLETAGRLGSGSALEILSELYLWRDIGHRSIGPDAKKSKDYLEQAVKLGNLDAERVLGEQLIGGWNFPKRPDRGVALLQDAIAHGDAKSSLSLGKFYFEGFYLKDKSELGKAMLKKAADAGDSAALVALGSGYMWGGLIPANPSLVMQYLSEAEAKGNWDAKRILGEQFIVGLCVPKDSNAGINKLRELIAAGDVESKRILGEHLVAGWAIEKSLAEGMKLLEDAARSGNSKAALSLAKALAEHGASEIEVKRGRAMIKSLADQRDGPALEYLGTQLMWKASKIGEQREAERLLTSAGNAGQATAWLTLAQGASFGKLGLAGKRKYQMFADKARAAQQGGIDVFDAQRWMWAMNSAKPNWSRGVSQLERAANSGNADAAITLVRAIRDGDGWKVGPNPKNALVRLESYSHILMPYKLQQQQLLIQSMSIKNMAGYREFSSTINIKPNIRSADFLKDLFKLNKRLAIYVLQERLLANRFYAGPVDGKFSPATRNAFQKACSVMGKSANCSSTNLSADVVAQLALQ